MAHDNNKSNHLTQIDPIIIEISRNIFQNIIEQNIDEKEIFIKKIIQCIIAKDKNQNNTVYSKYINNIFSNRIFLETIIFIIIIKLDKLINNTKSNNYSDITDEIIKLFWLAKKILLMPKKEKLNNLVKNILIESNKNTNNNKNTKYKKQIKDAIVLYLYNVFGNQITPFNFAIKYGNLEIIKIIVESYKELDQNLIQVKNKNGQLPIHLAILNNPDLSIIKYLVDEYKIGLSIEDKDFNLPIHLAILYNLDFSIVNYLIQNFDTAKHRNNNNERIKYGLKIITGYGYLPIHLAAKANIDKNNYENSKNNLIEIINKILEIVPETTKIKTSDFEGELAYKIAINEKKPQDIINLLTTGTIRMNVYGTVVGRK